MNAEYAKYSEANIGNASPTHIAVAVVRHAGRVLIGKRPEPKPLAGLWEFPGGKLKPSESLQQAAARECLEETRLEVIVDQPYGDVTHQYDHDRVCLHFFFCHPIHAGHSPKNPFRWVETAQLSNYAFPEANRELVKYLSGQGEASPG